MEELSIITVMENEIMYLYHLWETIEDVQTTTYKLMIQKYI